jgi:hypothetical protein
LNGINLFEMIQPPMNTEERDAKCAAEAAQTSRFETSLVSQPARLGNFRCALSISGAADLKSVRQ